MQAITIHNTENAFNITQIRGKMQKIKLFMSHDFPMVTRTATNYTVIPHRNPKYTELPTVLIFKIPSNLPASLYLLLFIKAKSKYSHYQKKIVLGILKYAIRNVYKNNFLKLEGLKAILME